MKMGTLGGTGWSEACILTDDRGGAVPEAERAGRAGGGAAVAGG